VASHLPREAVDLWNRPHVAVTAIAAS
jgi:hypothetical protein